MRQLTRLVFLASGLIIASNSTIFGQGAFDDLIPVNPSKELVIIDPFLTSLVCASGELVEPCAHYSLGKCVKRMSSVEKEQYAAHCAREERNTIYDNCVIEKSKGLDRVAVRSVRRVCEQISNKPSAWQRWRYSN